MKTNLKPLAGSILLLFASAAVAAPVNWAVSRAAKTVTAPAPKASIARPGENAAQGAAVQTRIENITTTAGSGKNALVPGLQVNGSASSGGKLPLNPLDPGKTPSSGSNNTLGNSLGLASPFRDPRGDPKKNKPNKTAQQSSGWSYSDSMTDHQDSKGNQNIVRVEHYEDEDHRMTITSTVKNGKETQDIVYVDKKTGEKVEEKSGTPAEKPKDPPPPEKPKDPPPPPPESNPADNKKTPLPDGVDGGNGGRNVMEIVKVKDSGAGDKARQSLSNPGHADLRAHNNGLMQNPAASRDPKAGLAPWIMPTEDGSSGKSSPIPVPASGNSPRVNLGTSLKDPGPLGDLQGGFGGSSTSGTAPR